MDGLIPAIVQDADTGQVLMLGYMGRAALAATLESGFATFFSRSKGRLWRKGETSGNRLAVRAVLADCDEDALLIRALPEGPTCHLGTTSCFGAEGVEVALAAVSRDAAGCTEEAADLIYHLMVLMEAKGFGWDDVARVLAERHK